MVHWLTLYQSCPNRSAPLKKMADRAKNRQKKKQPLNKRAKMSLNFSPEFKDVNFQIVCVVEIEFESAWALTNISSGYTCHAKLMHLRQLVIKKMIFIFPCECL